MKVATKGCYKGLSKLQKPRGEDRCEAFGLFARKRTRTSTPLRAQDSESCASAISPLARVRTTVRQRLERQREIIAALFRSVNRQKHPSSRRPRCQTAARDFGSRFLARGCKSRPRRLKWCRAIRLALALAASNPARDAVAARDAGLPRPVLSRRA